MKWYNTEIKDLSWASGLPACPCKIVIKTECVIRGIPYPGGGYPTGYGYTEKISTPKNPNPKEWQEPTNLQESLQDFAGYNYHPNAVYEIRTLDEYNGSGQQCTYDKKGKLITHGFDAGTEDRSYPTLNPWGGHAYNDVQPYDWAMELDGYPAEPKKYLKMYLEVRRQNNGNNCPRNP